MLQKFLMEEYIGGQTAVDNPAIDGQSIVALLYSMSEENRSKQSHF